MSRSWSGERLSLTPRDLAQWERADERLEAARYGDLTVSLVNRDGSPLPDVPVTFSQRSTDFLLGAQYPYDAQVYDLLQAAGVNAATLWLGWKHVEPEYGVFNWGFVDAVWRPDALARRKLDLAAHALLWGNQAWGVLPRHVVETLPNDLPHRVYELMGQVTRRYGGYVRTFELVNEPFWREANALGLSLDLLVRMCRAAALAIREQAPDARLAVSFGQVSRIPSYQIHPLEFLDTLDSHGVSVDVIGLECFENGYSLRKPETYYRSRTLAGILQTCSQYARADKAMMIHAAVPSQSAPSDTPRHYRPPYGPWDDERQAHYLDALYTLLAAIELVEGITWWCPVDGRLAHMENGGLISRDNQPKPAYEALKEWHHRHTIQTLVYTDGDGRARIRGLSGQYRIMAGKDVFRRAIDQHVVAKQTHDVTIVLGAS